MAEILAPHRLGEIIVHAGLQAAIPVALHGVGGHGDDRRPGPAVGLAVPNRPGRLEAIHDRHLNIHQHDVERFAIHRRKRLLPVTNNGHMVSQFLQHSDGHPLVDRIVLRQQHPQPSEWRRNGRRRMPHAVHLDGRWGGHQAERLGDHTQQFGCLDRLDQMGLQTQFPTTGGVTLPVRRGEHHDRGAGQFRFPGDRLGDHEAVHLRHHRIQKHEQIRPSRGHRPSKFRQGGPSGIDTRGDGLPKPQRFGQHAPVGRVVVDDQHRRVSQRRGRPGKRAVEGAVVLLEDDVKEKLTTLARLAGNTDGPAHHRDQAGRDREPQSGAAELPGRRTIRLGEGIEDRTDLGLGNADASVANAEPKTNIVLPPAGLVHTDHHLSLLGEFDGVADQICENLPQPPGVADHPVGDQRRDVTGKFQSLLVGPQRQGLEQVPDRVPKRERRRVEVELAGLDLRKIEDVVDDGQQRIGRGGHQAERLPLFRGEFRAQQQVGESDDAVHGRSNFMTHVREEFALRTTGRLRRLAGGTQFLLDSLAIGDVDHHDQQADHVAS